MNSILLSSAYLPPISYFAAIVKSPKILLDKHERYIKQTYRNRALICSPNGLHPLIIPVVHDDLYRKPIHEVKISYDSPWQKIHWRTITSSYRNSPYFEYFESNIVGFYEKRYETLFEFNLEFLRVICSMLRLDIPFEFTTHYEKELAEGITDLRDHFHPHARNPLPSYYQVFSDRNGFLPDLSIADLIFNKGKETVPYLSVVNIL